MQKNREVILCRYHYDPLDRLVDSTPLAQANTRRFFYLKDRLTTEIQGVMQRSIMQHDDQLLAQQQRQSTRVGTTLLATDQQRSVLNTLDTTQAHPLAYTPYGHRPAENGLLSLLGFNGERPDPVTGHYHLGNGYRQFNPVLMRFNSPDSWSPFGKGGINAYAYCVGDPVNRLEIEGRYSTPLVRLWKGFRNRIGIRTPSKFDTVQSKAINNKTVNADTTTSIETSKHLNESIANVDNKAHIKNADRVSETKKSFEQIHNASSRPQPIIDNPPLQPLAQNQYDDFLNNSLGSVNKASLEELIANNDWLISTPGPSRLAVKTNYALDKIGKKIRTQLN